MTTMDKFRLDGKVAIVTGASRNIGFEISRTFAEAGATVIMVARDEPLLASAVEQVAATAAAPIVPFRADVGVPESVASLAATAYEQFGRVDVLVNNAGATGGTHKLNALDVPDAAWEETFAVNVLAPYRLSRLIGRRMIVGDGGSIINVVSPSGFIPTPHMIAYGATKSALWMMTRYLAAECAPKVRVNALSPGMVWNGTASWAPDDPTGGGLVAMTPMGRMGDPTEVAPAALYLASEASSYTTGAVLMVSGGRPW